MRRRKAKIDKIIEVLKKESGLTAPEIARKTKTNISYTYMLLYRLEAGGKAEREWMGAWIWRLKR